MVFGRKEGSVNDDSSEGLDRSDRALDDGASEESTEIDVSRSSASSDAVQGSRRVPGGLTERLRDVLRDGADGDLLLERSDLENGVLQWLRALDLQVIGACRADERLKPLLKLNVSSGVAEDRLMTQLSQHFEASEVGMLARCLCIPLVSVRVGKVNKQGNLLCPTATRGHLNLTLLPSSDMRVSFSGDDGCTERLAIVNNGSANSVVRIEEISGDSSGRSFLLKLPGGQVSYFWCSERSQLHGMELLSKMKDLLRRKTSLSHLTGISESRLDSFATHLRAYLLGSTNAAEADSTALSSSLLKTASSSHDSDPDAPSSSTISKSSRFRLTAAHSAKMHPLYQSSLSPRSNTFKETGSCSIRSGAREKLRRRGEGHSTLLSISTQPVTSSSTSCTICVPSGSQFKGDELLGGSGSYSSVAYCLSEMPCPSSPLSPFSALPHLPSLVTNSTSLFSPYYCWCPPSTSSLQYTSVSPHLPSTLSDSLPLPPLSSLLSAAGPPVTLVSSKPLINLAELPTLDLPALFPEQIVRFPLTVSSLVTVPTSQQIPTFTPFMSDPIVHIPFIDVCSSGQGYLVSAGPAISSAIPPLLPSLVNPQIPEAESVAEKSARETLRMLMASTPIPTNPHLMRVFPAVLTSMDTNFCVYGNNHGTVVAGSRGLYAGICDVDAVASGVASMGLSSSRERGEPKGRNRGDMEELLQSSKVSEGFSCAEDDE